jgi:hypothetical protein
VAGFKSESVVDFTSESVADLRRNHQAAGERSLDRALARAEPVKGAVELDLVANSSPKWDAGCGKN